MSEKIYEKFEDDSMDLQEIFWMFLNAIFIIFVVGLITYTKLFKKDDDLISVINV